MQVEQGRNRVVIEGVSPEIDGGRFPIKRTVGEQVVVEADAFADGHDVLSCVLRYRAEDDRDWSETPMTPLVNDRWRGVFEVQQLGRYVYTIQGWIDRFKSWSRDFAKRVQADQDVAVDLLIGAELVEAAAQNTGGAAAERLQSAVRTLRAGGRAAIAEALSSELSDLMYQCAERHCVSTYRHELAVVVDRERARFGAWYELFPRSCSPEPGRHGTFKDVERRLPYVASMGFDVLYLTPIHPIGHQFRKGKNNSVVAEPGDPGVPYAIGNEEGGHKSIHPQLGTLEDFRSLVERAKQYNLEVALDIALQASPDHPYVKEHPEWFRMRPDGTIQYAENPPKKYQDIYPFDFETENWRELWEEMKSIFLFWIEQGVYIFRVDNPHTKTFAFWEWLIDEIKRDYPETILLSEAFTRPKVMYRLAKLGFTQSYNYFPWRNTRWELTQFMTELTQTQVREFLRPSLWPNTHDILTEYLQLGGRPGHITRFVLAATLGATYGIYGPAFELFEHQPLAPGREEYLNSEKYEIKQWDLDRPDSLRGIIARVNRIRRENPALHSNDYVRFHATGNEQLIAYTKSNETGDNMLLMVVNLDPHHTQSGSVELPLSDFGIDEHQPFQVHDLLSDARYLWNGAHNYIELNPQVMPASIFRLRRRIRTEQDFDYYM